MEFKCFKTKLSDVICIKVVTKKNGIFYLHIDLQSKTMNYFFKRIEVSQVLKKYHNLCCRRSSKLQQTRPQK